MHGNVWEWTADYNDCDFLSTSNLFCQNGDRRVGKVVDGGMNPIIGAKSKTFYRSGYALQEMSVFVFASW